MHNDVATVQPSSQGRTKYVDKCNITMSTCKTVCLSLSDEYFTFISLVSQILRIAVVERSDSAHTTLHC